MLYIFPILILLIIILFIIEMRNRKNFDFEKVPLLNPGEKVFYEILKLITANKYEVFAKVRFIDVLKINARGKKYFRNKAKVIQKHIDFVLCEPGTYDVKLAIELDGKTHLNNRQKIKDQQKKEILSKAGIPLMRVQAKKTYNSAELKSKIEELIPLAPKTPQANIETLNIKF